MGVGETVVGEMVVGKMGVGETGVGEMEGHRTKCWTYSPPPIELP
jgi:hypothetical protein